MHKSRQWTWSDFDSKGPFISQQATDDLQHYRHEKTEFGLWVMTKCRLCISLAGFIWAQHTGQGVTPTPPSRSPISVQCKTVTAEHFSGTASWLVKLRHWEKTVKSISTTVLTPQNSLSFTSLTSQNSLFPQSSPLRTVSLLLASPLRTVSLPVSPVVLAHRNSLSPTVSLPLSSPLKQQTANQPGQTGEEPGSNCWL